MRIAMYPFAALMLTSPLMFNCGPLPGPAGELAGAASCPEMKDGNFANLAVAGGGDVEAKVKGFLDASFTLDKMVTEMELSLIASCAELGRGIGMSDAELSAQPGGGEGGKKVCAAVAAKVDGILKANASAKLTLDWKEPTCYIDIDAMNGCLAGCGAVVEPGNLDASCDGGEVSGQCDAECKGSCTVEASAECSGECSGTCEGKCEADFRGECGGTCNGKCDGKDSSGKCTGKCEGKCDAQAKGSCGGSCEGSCSASCKMEGKADCSGSCSGGCTADVKAPKCSGDFNPPKVDPTCHLKCTLTGMASASCDPPKLIIKVDGQANAEIEGLVLALQTSLPNILKIQLGAAKRVGAAATGVVQTGVEVKDVAANAGAQALLCIGVAGTASAKAAASIDVNVEASASVSASASGKASGSAGG